MRVLLVVVACLCVHPNPGASQVRPLGPAPSPLFTTAPGAVLRTTFSEERGDSARRVIRPTYWKKGAAIGGAVGALSGLLLAHALCGLSEEAGQSCSRGMLMGVVGGGLALAIPGAFIGGQFANPEE